MTYTPASNLAYTRTYNVTVGTGAMDLAGNSLSVPYEWNFTTMDPGSNSPGGYREFAHRNGCSFGSADNSEL